MKHLFFLLTLCWSCSKHNLNAQNHRQLYDYTVTAKLVGKSILKDTYVYLFKDEEKSYKVISNKDCDFITDNIYNIDLLLLKRPENTIPNLSIQNCVFNKRDKICTDIEYTHLYKLQSDCNVDN